MPAPMMNQRASNKVKEDKQKTRQENDFEAICRIAEELDVAAQALDKTANSRNENSIKEQLKQNNPAYFNQQVFFIPKIRYEKAANIYASASSMRLVRYSINSHGGM